jgi:SAM-dependent methyltransferase
MASVTQSFMKLFRGSSGQPPSSAPKQQMSRRSSGLGELARMLESQDPLCVLDLGATSANNIRFFTGRSHRIYSEDLLLASVDPSLRIKDEEGKLVIDTKRFLEENLAYSAAHFDVVFAWNLPDYMDEELVKPVIDRLWSTLKPGGMLLAFFHTRDAGPDAPCYRFHITGKDSLDMQEIKLPPQSRGHSSSGFRLQRVFNNRHIENLFRDFASIKFFLARDNVREVLVVR